MPSGPILVCAKHSSWADIPILAVLTRRSIRRYPRFQMGSFVGYRVLGLLRPLLCRLGGFCVMRPKEALRLRKRLGCDRVEALRRMEEVNSAAEATRRSVLRRGGVLVVFPEGTRDDAQVRPLRGDLEIRSALSILQEGVVPWFWPVVLSYGPRRRIFRRPVFVEGLPPFAARSSDPGEVMQQLASLFVRHWVPPEKVIQTIRSRNS